MSRGGVKELAKKIGISIGAVRKAIADGRITTFIKNSKGYEFDIDLAAQEYELNTNPSLSSNSSFFADDEDDEKYDSEISPPSDEPDPEKYFMDRDPRGWNINQASQAFAIFKALKMRHELDVTKGKYYPKKDADQELDRIVNTFTRSLIQLPSKIKQKIPILSDREISLIKNLCQELSEELKRKI